MRKLAIAGLAVLLVGGASPRAQQCADGSSPATEVGARYQLSEQVMTATANNPFPLVAESATSPVRYIRARLTAKSLGSGRWYVTVRDLRGHVLQTFSRDDFAVAADRWTVRIAGAAATIDLALVGAAVSPEIQVTEYVAMPDKVTNSYYSVKRRGMEEFRPLYTGSSTADRKFRPWGDGVGFLMASWGRQLWGCSGMVVGPRLMLTAWHCGGLGEARMPAVAHWNTDICRDLLIDLSWDDDLLSRDFGCVRVIDKSQDLDFALLEIAPIAATSEARPLRLSDKPLRRDDPLVVIHHPLYMQKQLTTDCRVDRAAVPGWMKTADLDFSHDCDSEGGSSGAPVFNGAGEVVGLHHFGHAIHPETCLETDAVNKAVRIDKILEFLRGNRARNENVVDRLSVAP